MQETKVEREFLDWEILLSRLLAERDEATRSKVRNSSWVRKQANLRRGVNEETEHFAYPEVLPFIEGNEKKQKVVLRLCALVAEFPEILQSQREEGKRAPSLGKWVFLLSLAKARKENSTFEFNPNNPDTLAQRLKYLHTQDVEDAIASVRRIFFMAKTLGEGAPAIDYYQLFRTFLYWGDGFTPNSISNRSRILRDYYSGSLVSEKSTVNSEK